MLNSLIVMNYTLHFVLPIRLIETFIFNKNWPCCDFSLTRRAVEQNKEHIFFKLIIKFNCFVATRMIPTAIYRTT